MGSLTGALTGAGMVNTNDASAASHTDYGEREEPRERRDERIHAPFPSVIHHKLEHAMPVRGPKARSIPARRALHSLELRPHMRIQHRKLKLDILQRNSVAQPRAFDPSAFLRIPRLELEFECDEVVYCVAVWLCLVYPVGGVVVAC